MSAPPGEPGSGLPSPRPKLRISIGIVLDAADAGKIRLAVDSDSQVSALEAPVRARATTLPPGAAFVGIEGADGSALFGEDLLEDVWRPEEPLTARFTARFTTGSAAVPPPAPRAAVSVTVKRLVGQPTEAVLTIDGAGRTTVAELKGLLQGLWPDSDPRTTTLALQLRRLPDTDIVQSLVAPGQAVLSLHAFASMSVGREGSAAPPRPDPAPLTVRYRRLDTGAARTIMCTLAEPLQSLISRIAAAEGLGPPSPRTGPPKSPRGTAASPRHRAASPTPTAAEVTGSRWAPAGALVALARRSHFLYPSPTTAMQSLEAWGFAEDPFVLVILVGVQAREGSFVASLMPLTQPPAESGYMEALAASPAWAPPQCPAQTDAGMACMLSSLYVLAEKLRGDTSTAGKALSRIRALTGSDPAALALHCLIRKRAIGPVEKAALSAALYRLGRQLAPPDVPNTRVLEGCRTILYYLVSVAGGEGGAEGALDAEDYVNVSLTCPLTLRRLVDPVLVVKEGQEGSEMEVGKPLSPSARPTVVVSRLVAAAALASGDQLPMLGLTATEAVSATLKPAVQVSHLLLCSPSARSVEVWAGAEATPENEGMDVTDTVDWQALLRCTRTLPMMQVVRPLGLSRAMPPCLTLDQNALLAVYLGRTGKGGDVNKATSLFRPLYSGHPDSVDRNHVAQAIARLIGEGADASLSSGLQEEREADEAIVVLLDTSNSMSGSSFVEGDKGSEDEEDGEDEDEEDEDDEMEGQEEGAGEEEGAGGIPSFPEPTQVPCPHELLCPLTRGIMLDPVTASDGATYERAAIARWIAERTRNVQITIPSPLGRGRLDVTVELRSNEVVAKRVQAWLRNGYPACLGTDDGRAATPSPTAARGAAQATPPTTNREGAAAPASASAPAATGASTGGAFSTMISGLLQSTGAAPPPPPSITIESEYAAPTTLDLPATTTVRGLLQAWFGRMQLPLTAPASRFRLMHKHRNLCALDLDKTLGELGIQGAVTMRLEINRPRDVAKTHLPLVVHMGRKQKKGGLTHDYSLLVRADVTAKRLIRHLANEGRVSGRLSHLGLWYKLSYVGDNCYRGYHIEQEAKLHSIGSNFPTHTGYELECDGISHLKTKKKSGPKELTRLEVVKQLCEHFVNRNEAYDFSTECALVLFGSKVKEECALTPLLEDFRTAVTRVEAAGDTCLYDAIEHATLMLSNWKKSHPKASLRMLCLSDGEDTDSTATHTGCAKRLQEEGIVLDAILIGAAQNKYLRGIAKATNGYAFQPSSLRDALKLNELETLMSSHMRAPYTGPPLRKVNNVDALLHFSRMPLDVCNEMQVPAARQHPGLSGKVMGLDAAILRQQGAGTAAAGGAPGSMSNVMRRLCREMQLLAGPEKHPAFTIMPSVEDLLFWRLLLKGPEGSLYAGGVWLLYMEFPATFPLEPPVVRFVTPVMHCNVNPYGRICHSILDRNWTADTKLSTLLGCVYGLLLNPDTSDPLDSDLAAKFYDANGQYEASIMQHCELHAKAKSLEQWKAEMEADDKEAQGVGVAAEPGAAVTESFTEGAARGPRRSRRKRSEWR